MAAKRSILIFGAGSVGGYLGGKLAASDGLDVTLLGRRPLVEAAGRRGLVVREHGSELVTHPAVVDSIAAQGPFDLVMLTVRTYDVAPVLPDLPALLGSSGLLLALQNGVGTEEQVATALGRHRVLAGTLTVRPGMDEPGVVTRYSRSGGIALSMMDGSAVPGWIIDAFRSTGLPTVTIQDYRSLRWSKLLLNLLGASNTAILDIDMEELVRSPRLFRLEQLAFREAGRVMDAQNIRTVSLPGYPVPLARLVMRLPRPLAQKLIGPRLARARGGHAPSMRSDLKRGKAEVASLNGAVARVAGDLHIAAPTNAAFTTLATSLARNPSQRAAFYHNPNALVAYMREHSVKI